MSELLIIFAVLAIGKIHGQEAVVLHVTNIRSLHVPTFDRRPVSYQEYSGLRTPQPPLRLYTNPPRPADRDLTQKPKGSGKVNLVPSTVRENPPKLFLSYKIPNKMNRPLSDSDPVDNSEYFSNDVYEDIRFEKNKNPGQVNPLLRKNTVNVKSENVTTVKPVNKNITNDGSVPTVTVEDRSSFTGDQCPTGFAKVNGQCVKADQN